MYVGKSENDVMYGKGKPMCWRKRVLIQLYKIKGDTKKYSSHRNLKMLKHAIKVLKRVFQEKFQETVEINKTDMDVIPAKVRWPLSLL